MYKLDFEKRIKTIFLYNLLTQVESLAIFISRKVSKSADHPWIKKGDSFLRGRIK